jgi:hypothetical protein
MLTKALLAVGLTWGLGLSASAAPESRGIGPWNGGCVRTAVHFEGTLVLTQALPIVRCLDFDVNRQGDLPFPRRTVWQLRTSDRSYTLDLTSSPALWKRANELVNKTVVVSGDLVGGVVRVTALEANNVVEITGKMDRRVIFLEQTMPAPIEIEMWPSRRVVLWSLEAEGKTYSLTFATPELEAKARLWVGKTIKVRGALQGRALLVRDIETIGNR